MIKNIKITPCPQNIVNLIACKQYMQMLRNLKGQYQSHYGGTPVREVPHYYKCLLTLFSPSLKIDVNKRLKNEMYEKSK
jgi:hypothetical protein